MSRLEPHRPRAIVEIGLVEVPDLPFDSSTYSPHLAAVTFDRIDSAWTVTYVQVSGVYRRIDGSLGSRRVCRSWGLVGPEYWNLTNAPEVVREALAEAQRLVES